MKPYHGFPENSRPGMTIDNFACGVQLNYGDVTGSVWDPKGADPNMPHKRRSMLLINDPFHPGHSAEINIFHIKLLWRRKK